MEVELTARGFMRAEFRDGNGEACSAQVSSACRDEAMLWLGVDEVTPKILSADHGWVDIPLPKGAFAAARMHLSQSHIRALLPLLHHFAERGELPREDADRMLPPGVGCPCCRLTTEPKHREEPE